MDGWQLPLAPEQAFSLALAQERVGVMKFATPSDAMTMNFVPVVTGAAGAEGAPGEGLANFNVDLLANYLLSSN